MNLSFLHRKSAQTACIFLAVMALAATASAQPATGKKPSAKIQGESLDAPVTPSSDAPTAAPPVATSTQAGASAAATPGLAATNTNAAPNGGFALKDGYLVVDFDRLAAYDYDPEYSDPKKTVGKEDATDWQIPAAIKALENKKVMLRGFMMPLIMDGDKTTVFLITRNQMCCAFGPMTKMNELATVKVTGEGVDVNMNDVVTIKGTLHVGALRQDDEITSIYRIDGETLLDEVASQ